MGTFFAYNAHPKPEEIQTYVRTKYGQCTEKTIRGISRLYEKYVEKYIVLELPFVQGQRAES